MPDQEKMACTDRRRCTGLLDLPENLITSILQRLPAKSKCQAEVVCKSLREVLGNPAPGTFVRGCLDLEDPFFERAPLQELNRHAFSIPLDWSKASCSHVHQIIVYCCSTSCQRLGHLQY